MSCAVGSCRLTSICGLHKKAKSVQVGGRGKEDHPLLMLVGEAPGPDEDAQGEPFIGRAGKKLDEVLETVGIPKDEIWITNAVRCYPRTGDGFRSPNFEEALACSIHLHEDIERVQPTVIVALGRVAAFSLVGVEAIKTTRETERVLQLNGRAIPVRITYHPSAVARNPNNLPHLRDDLESAWKRARSLTTVGRASVSTESRAPVDVQYTVDADRFVEWISKARKGKCIGLDTESASTEANKKAALRQFDPATYPLGVGISWDPKTAVYLSLEKRLTDRHPPMSSEDRQKVGKALRAMFKRCRVSMDNGVYDLQVLWKVFGIKPFRLDFDPMLADYLISGHLNYHKLESMCHRILEWPLYKSAFVKELRVLGGTGSFDLAPLPRLAEICGWDSAGALGCTLHLEEKIKKMELDWPLQLLLWATEDFSYIEAFGNARDEEWYEHLLNYYESHMTEAATRIAGMPVVGKWERRAEKKFKPGSDDHVRELLYETLNLSTKGIGKTRTGLPEIGEEALKIHMKRSEDKDLKQLLEDVLLHKRCQKFRSTYLVGIQSWSQREKDEKSNLDVSIFRPSYNMIKQKNARFSTGDPGYHTFPRKSAVRGQFVSRWREIGGVLLGADYKQAEMRVLAAESGDETLTRLVQKEDVHASLAAELDDCDVSEVSDLRRQETKSLNFSIIFGVSAPSLARKTGKTEEEAEEFLREYFDRLPDVEKYIKRKHREAEKYEAVRTPGGRIRWIPEVTSDNKHQYQHALRIAQNAPIQAGSSDATLTSLLLARRRIRAHTPTLWSEITRFLHDDVGTDVYPGELPVILPIIREAMEEEVRETLDWLGVPMVAEFKLEPRWDGGVEVTKVLSESPLVLEVEGKMVRLKELVTLLRKGYGTVDVNVEETIKAKTSQMPLYKQVQFGPRVKGPDVVAQLLIEA